MEEKLSEFVAMLHIVLEPHNIKVGVAEPNIIAFTFPKGVVVSESPDWQIAFVDTVCRESGIRLPREAVFHFYAFGEKKPKGKKAIKLGPKIVN